MDLTDADLTQSPVRMPRVRVMLYKNSILEKSPFFPGEILVHMKEKFVDDATLNEFHQHVEDIIRNYITKPEQHRYKVTIRIRRVARKSKQAKKTKSTTKKPKTPKYHVQPQPIDIIDLRDDF